MTTNIPYFRPHKCRTQIRSVSCLIIIIITLNLQTNFLKPISITYIYYFELSSTPTISHSHCQFEQKHTNKHTHITVSERLVNNIYVLNSAAARQISKKRDTVCRRKLLPLSQGDDPEKKKALAHYNICSDDLDALQIFLPWSWSNCHPQPVLSSHPKAFNDPAYFPYNKYIFSRALLTEEERQESECRCYHFLPCPETRPADTWYDWPCGCRKKVCIIITSEVVEEFPRFLVMTGEIDLLGQAYIVCPLTHNLGGELVRFTVPPRSTTFPVKSRRKRRSTFGRALSLTDRKHYKMGRSNANT